MLHPVADGQGQRQRGALLVLQEQRIGPSDRALLAVDAVLRCRQGDTSGVHHLDGGLQVTGESDGTAGHRAGHRRLGGVVDHQHVALAEDRHAAIGRQAHRVEADQVGIERQGAVEHAVVAQ
ncbi:hypothetical protein D3C78_867150 [compost metagenome]